MVDQHLVGVLVGCSSFEVGDGFEYRVLARCETNK
jgi:hypothetical protein